MLATAAHFEVSSREDTRPKVDSPIEIVHVAPVRERRRRRERTRPFDPWSDLEWEEHEEAQRIVAENPDGMTLEEVGKVLGITRERVRQIEAVAMRKLRTGVGLGETVEIEDGAITVPIVICEECDRFFPRMGRRKLCEVCDPPTPPPPPPPVEEANLPDFHFSLIFKFSL